MSINYESLLANEAAFNAQRESNGLEPLPLTPPVPDGMGEPSQGVDVAMGSAGKAVGATLREIMGSLGRMGKAKTDDILDKVENPKSLMSPEAIDDLEAVLTPQAAEEVEAINVSKTEATQELEGTAPTPKAAEEVEQVTVSKTEATQELEGTVPIDASNNAAVQQETPFFKAKPIDNEQILNSAQDGKDPTGKLSGQRSYNTERHHEGARQAINKTFDEIQSAEEFGRVLEFISEQTGAKTSQSFADIRKAVGTSKDIFSQLEPILKGTQKGLLTAEQNYAGRVLASSLFEQMKRTANAIGEGDDSAEMLLRQTQTTEQLNFIIQYMSNNASETGRALSSHRMIAQSVKLGSLEDMSKMLDSVGGAQDIKHQAALINNLVAKEAEGGESAAPSFMASLARRYKLGVTASAEYWRAQILTGVKTHIVNLTGSAMMNGWDNLVIRPTAAALSSGRKGISRVVGKEIEPDYVAWSEVLAANVTTFTASTDALRMMIKAFKQNEGRFTGSTKGAEENIGAFNNVMSFFGQPGKVTADIALGSYRMLGAEDEAFKTIAYRQELSGQAIRTAIKEGLTGKSMWSRAEELVNMPTKEMHASSMDFAKRTTFQDEIDTGQLSKAVDLAKSSVRNRPELAFILPFINTPTNLARRVLEMSPMGIGSSRIREQLSKGGAERDIAAAKLIWGFVGTGVAITLYENRIITGPGPEKWGVKEAKTKAGWQPNAFRIGEKYYGIDRLAPFGQAMSLMPAYLDQAKYAGTQAEFEEAMLSASLIMADNMSQMPFLQGLNNLMESVRTDRGKFKKMTGNIAAGFVPYSSMLKDIKNYVDDEAEVRRVSQDKYAQAGVTDFVKQTAFTRLPGLSFNMRPGRYWDGTVKLPQAGQFAHTMSPFKVGKLQPPDKANSELIIQQVNIAEPKPIVAFAGVEFSLVELDAGKGKIYDTYIQRVGEARRTLFNEIVDSKGYQEQNIDGPDSIRAGLLIGGEARAKKMALARFLEEDLSNLLADAETLSPIGRELRDAKNIKEWLGTAMEEHSERREADKDYEKSVRLKGKAARLDPKDIKLDPLH